MQNNILYFYTGFLRYYLMRTEIVFLLAIFIILARPVNGQVAFVTPPAIRWVTVDTATGYVGIAWSASPDRDIEKYAVYRDSLEVHAAYAVDTVSAETLNYLHRTQEALNRSLAYTVAAIDSAGNISTYPESHSTLYLDAVYDTCESRINLIWSQYGRWVQDDSLAAYNLFFSQNSRPYRTLDLPKNPADTNRYHPVIENQEYCYFVEAVHLDGKRRSVSNISCVSTTMSRHPAYINADYATIAEAGIVKLSFSYDPLSEIKDFEILRGKENVSQINFRIARLTGVMENPLIHYDTIPYDTTNYYYRLEAKDICDRTVTTSNIAGPMVLLAEWDKPNVELNWTPYTEWLGSIGRYSIYRIVIITNPDTVLLDSVNYRFTSFTDNLEELYNQGIEGHICYYILAREDDGNPYGIFGQSQSNVVCVDIRPDVYMPDAFSPNGDDQNEKIGPLFTFDPKTFYFVIYDRWGGKVFETSDKYNRLWDGTIRGGQKAAPGVYTYYLKLTTSSSLIFEERETITLIYP